MAVLESPQPPPIESILTTLLNEIAAFPDNFILVLDDYHVVDSKAVDQALEFLVEHLPSQMHLVIATREDPASAPRPLARPRSIDRTACRRPAFYACRSSRIPQPGDGSEPLGGRYHRLGDTAPKAGSPACSWLRFPCRGIRIPPVSSDLSPAAIILCWTI